MFLFLAVMVLDICPHWPDRGLILIGWGRIYLSRQAVLSFLQVVLINSFPGFLKDIQSSSSMLAAFCSIVCQDDPPLLQLCWGLGSGEANPWLLVFHYVFFCPGMLLLHWHWVEDHCHVAHFPHGIAWWIKIYWYLSPFISQSVLTRLNWLKWSPKPWQSLHLVLQIAVDTVVPFSSPPVSVLTKGFTFGFITP